MAVGRALGGGLTDQAICVVYKDFNAGGPAAQILVNGCRSTGLGLLSGPFGSVSVHPANVPGPGNDFFQPSCAIGPNGDLYVTWIERNGNTAPTNVFINRDNDGLGAGAFGFGLANVVATVPVPNTRPPGVFPNPQLARGYACTPAVEVVQTGPFAGRVVCAYDDKVLDDGVPGDEVSFGYRIATRYSDDTGVTWSGPTIAHPIDTRHQFMPWLGVDHATGAVYVTWYDSRNDAANNRAVERFSAVSVDGSAWVNPLLLAQNPSDTLGATDGNDYLEYCGVAAAGGLVWACWCSFETGNGEVFASPYQQNP
jgi:hypothetical protein